MATTKQVKIFHLDPDTVEHLRFNAIRCGMSQTMFLTNILNEYAAYYSDQIQWASEDIRRERGHKWQTSTRNLVQLAADRTINPAMDRGEWNLVKYRRRKQEEEYETSLTAPLDSPTDPAV